MAGVKLSVIALEQLTRVMNELEMERNDRPDAIKLAFSKGIAATSPPTEFKKEASKFEFPTSVVAKGDEIPLIRHLIIEKIGRKIEDNQLDKYILLFVEHGLMLMDQEIQELSSADNYLLYLLEKHNIS